MTQTAKNNLVNIQIQRVASVDKAANRRTFAIIKRAASPPDEPEQPARTQPVDPPSSPKGETVTKAADTAQKPSLEGLNADQKAYVESLEKNQKPGAAPEEVDLSTVEDYETEINKMDASPSLKAHLIKTEKQAREDRRIAKEERDARRRNEHISKAASDFGLINKNAEGLGDLTMRLQDQCDDMTYGEVMTVLKSASQIAKSGDIFKELGDGGEATSGSASEEVTKRAVELRKNDSSLSMAAAKDKVAQADPELRKRWQEEQQGNQ